MLSESLSSHIGDYEYFVYVFSDVTPRTVFFYSEDEDGRMPEDTASHLRR
jgi:hypothetical protein